MGENLIYSPDDVSCWGEGDYVIFKGNNYGHVGSWTKNYRGQEGLWHNSSGRGVHFTKFGSSEWINILTKNGAIWPWIIRKP